MSMAVVAQSNPPLYIRRHEGCAEIPAGHRERVYEFLGKNKDNGGVDMVSVALVVIEEGGYSLPHLHEHNDECYIVVDGRGKVNVGGHMKEVTAGDLVFIPENTAHQIQNDNKDPLRFFCMCAPSWTYDCYTPVEKMPTVADPHKDKMYVRRTDESERTFIELLGKENGKCDKMSIAFLQLSKDITEKGLDSGAEKSYLILKGKAVVEIGEAHQAVQAGDLIKIPVGTAHKISNKVSEQLEVLYTRAPAPV